MNPPTALSDQARKLLVAQLLATRDTLLATTSQIDAALMACGIDVDRLAEPPIAEGCPHPSDMIENLHTTLDDAPDDYVCRQCGAHSPTPFHSED